MKPLSVSTKRRPGGTTEPVLSRFSAQETPLLPCRITHRGSTCPRRHRQLNRVRYAGRLPLKAEWHCQKYRPKFHKGVALREWSAPFVRHVHLHPASAENNKTGHVVRSWYQPYTQVEGRPGPPMAAALTVCWRRIAISPVAGGCPFRPPRARIRASRAA